MKNVKSIEKTVDVLVMGGSAGGLPAALRARESGAETAGRKKTCAGRLRGGSGRHVRDR